MGRYIFQARRQFQHNAQSRGIIIHSRNVKPPRLASTSASPAERRYPDAPYNDDLLRHRAPFMGGDNRTARHVMPVLRLSFVV